MKKEINDDYELIAKHCPSCQSLVMARVEKQKSGKMKYNGYKCSVCDWSSPSGKNRK
jgi:predicted RNA-binding Zn-ribbon protein involved in translation (DUF1610 family)